MKSYYKTTNKSAHDTNLQQELFFADDDNDVEPKEKDIIYECVAIAWRRSGRHHTCELHNIRKRYAWQRVTIHTDKNFYNIYMADKHLEIFMHETGPRGSD